MKKTVATFTGGCADGRKAINLALCVLGRITTQVPDDADLLLASPYATQSREYLIEHQSKVVWIVTQSQWENRYKWGFLISDGIFVLVDTSKGAKELRNLCC